MRVGSSAGLCVSATEDGTEQDGERVTVDIALYVILIVSNTGHLVIDSRRRSTQGLVTEEHLHRGHLWRGNRDERRAGSSRVSCSLDAEAEETIGGHKLSHGGSF